MKAEVAICTECRYALPYTRFTDTKDNPVTKMLWGRVPVEHGLSLVAYSKGGRVQEILHAIKYQGNTQAGQELGRMLGHEIKEKNLNIDTIVPVPLHPKKQKARGYNQAQIIAEGVAEVLSLPIDSKAVKRVGDSSSQTRKGRLERWENVEEIFKITDKDRLLEQHILLVDDVVTTGATLEACAAAICSGPAARISVATVACVV